MKPIVSAGLALALATPLVALAQTPSNPPAEIQLLRQEIEHLRATYEARLQALEQRLNATQQQAAATPSAGAPVPAVAAASAMTTATSLSIGATVAAGANTNATGANLFNPAMSLILSGGYTGTMLDPAGYNISGFQLPVSAPAGPGRRGFSLAESELGFAASIDPWLSGAAHLSLHADNTMSVEEAFIQTTALGNGLSLKAGRFFSGVGYLNSQHAHTWDFADNPLAYQAMLGTQYGDDGVQLRWLAPTDHYLELGLELGRGRSFPGSDTDRNGAGMAALTLHTGGDVGASHNWRAGLSVLAAKADTQALAAIDANGALVGNLFSGNTRVVIADAVWKWAPNGNATRTNFKLQGEYLQSTRTGNLTYDATGANVTDFFSAEQSGWYLQGVYQFMPRWRVGLRTERLDAGTSNFGINAAAMAGSAYQPSKNSVMLDYNPSEFSRVRLQVAQDLSAQGLINKQLFLLYQMSLGAHGAHSY